MRLFRRQPAEKRLHGNNRQLSRLFLVLFFVGYWIFVWQLEQIEVVQTPGMLWERFVSIYPLMGIFTPVVLLLLELFSPRVLRQFIPLAAGWWLAREAIARLLESFYDLPDTAGAKSLLGRLLSAQAPAMTVKVRREQFEVDRRQNPLLNIGGPGFIAVSPGDAVVTEHNGRFRRVLGPGVHALDRFEYVSGVADLRPQERKSDGATMTTSDGIELSVEVSVKFQIISGEEKPSKRQPYPYEDGAVRKAAYAVMNVGDGKLESWESLVLGFTLRKLRDIIAEVTLDDIVFSNEPGIHVHQRLEAETRRRTQPVAREYGVEVTETRLGRLELPASVNDQHIEYWRSYWDGQRMIRAAEGKAKEIEDSEAARAEAEAIMIQAIAEGLQRVQRTGKDVKSKEIIALRFIEAMESLAHQSEQVLPLPQRLLPTLSDLRQQLLLGNNPVGEITD